MFCLLFAMPPTERVIGKWQKTSSLDAPPSTGLTFTFSSIYKIKCEIKLLHMCLRGPHALQLYGDKEVWGVDSFNPIQSMEINLGPSLMSSRNQHQGLIFLLVAFIINQRKKGYKQPYLHWWSFGIWEMVNWKKFVIWEHLITIVQQGEKKTSRQAVWCLLGWKIYKQTSYCLYSAGHGDHVANHKGRK